MIVISILAAALVASPFTPFEGHWRCEGYFISSGKKIVSELSMAVDPKTGAFVVHHDDTAPLEYHSMEMWTADPKDGSVRSAVSDKFSGLRVFRSPPVKDGVLAFSRPENGAAIEEFRYTLKAPDVLQVDWSIVRNGQPMQLGDTLACRRDTP